MILAAGGTPTPVQPTVTPAPAGQFAMDLYQPGDFVGEFKNTWCIPAAIQTSMNIMDAGADTTQDTQAKLFDLGNSIAESRNGSPDPEGWSGGLQQLGYGQRTVRPGFWSGSAGTPGSSRASSQRQIPRSRTTTA